MGAVIDMATRRRERGRADGPAERLEGAVRRLEAIVAALARTGTADPETETELLAITGAVRIGLADEAADRAERLLRRLEGRAVRGS